MALALSDLVAPELAGRTWWSWPARAENDFVGAPTGILDQSASVLCTAGHALFLDTRDLVSEQVPLDLAAAGLALLVVDSGVTHDHAEGGYGDRRRECEEAATRLGVGLLREVTTSPRSRSLDDGTPEGEVLLRRARHIVTENARVLEVVATLRGDADPRAIGPILTAGHASLRDDFEISIPLLDACVEAALEAGAHGARMVGGGFGGSAIALVEADAVEGGHGRCHRPVRPGGRGRAAHVRHGPVRRRAPAGLAGLHPSRRRRAGPVARRHCPGGNTQNSLPSGSAITTQLTSPWPMSMRVAPRETRRSTSAC